MQEIKGTLNKLSISIVEQYLRNVRWFYLLLFFLMGTGAAYGILFFLFLEKVPEQYIIFIWSFLFIFYSFLIILFQYVTRSFIKRFIILSQIAIIVYTCFLMGKLDVEVLILSFATLVLPGICLYFILFQFVSCSLIVIRGLLDFKIIKNNIFIFSHGFFYMMMVITLFFLGIKYNLFIALIFMISFLSQVFIYFYIWFKKDFKIKS